MAKNKDGFEAGADVSWADMVAANAKRADAKPAKKKTPKSGAKKDDV